MDFSDSLTPTTHYNPYERSRTQQNGNRQFFSGQSANNTQPRLSTMGIQSQRREGSVKACKKRATSVKHRLTNHIQRTMEGDEAFDRMKDCNICVIVQKIARGEKIRKPKRMHHALCYLNSKTHGISATSVFVE